jgi:hypothetical protein
MVCRINDSSEQIQLITDADVLICARFRAIALDPYHTSTWASTRGSAVLILQSLVSRSVVLCGIV